MKRASAVICVLFLATTVVAQQLTQTDRDKGVQYLQQTQGDLLAAVSGLSDAQMKFKPAPDRWSVAEVLEHITLAEDFIFNNVTANVMKAGAGPASRDVAKADSMVLAIVPDRSSKRQAPPPLVPTDRWTPPEAIDQFQRSRAKTIAFMEGTPDLRAHVADSPLGSLDAYEWLLFTGAHSARHTKQILEVKADPNFPKN